MIVFLVFQTCIQMTSGCFQVSIPEGTRCSSAEEAQKNVPCTQKAFSQSVPQMFPESQGLWAVRFQQVTTGEKGALCAHGRLSNQPLFLSGRAHVGLWDGGHLSFLLIKEGTIPSSAEVPHSKYCFTHRFLRPPPTSLVLLVPQFCIIYASVFISLFPDTHYVQPEGIATEFLHFIFFLVWDSFSFSALADLELIIHTKPTWNLEIYLPASPVLRLKEYATTAWVYLKILF